MSVVRKLTVRLVKTSENDAQILREARLAPERLTTPLQRIQWLVQFAVLASSDPARLTGAELARWNGEILGFASAAGQPQPLFRMKRDARLGSLGMTAEEIVEFAQRIRDALVKLIGGEMWAFANSGLQVDISLTSPKHGPPQRVYSGDMRGILIMAALDALVVESHRLAKCQRPGCERLFVRRKRGSYCSKRCSQRARTLRYLSSISAEKQREQRHAHYVAKVRREKGQAVVVGRNQPILTRAVEREAKR